ncbi:hypothetical protein BFP76_03785 [Amylibacter kogurei]|uniref:PepSY domain-containing protein n=1 Tax=Paramylibacter kogurei TaxID=1889778 RepID=A0A2G5K472_9RHOB|nr:hypothetical protein [Amylibacter kogurei]PIB24347.1 hypothetical protein BFP76_03785 [Amylibacter kogurei]
MLKFTRTVIIVSLAVATPSFAQQAATPADIVVRQLVNQGFTITNRGRTWLGRTIITAQKGMVEREIVVARGSGQILQDDWVFDPDAGDEARAEEDAEDEEESDPRSGGGHNGGGNNASGNGGGHNGGGHNGGRHGNGGGHGNGQGRNR